MLRDYLTNIKFLGAIGFLIVLSVACMLWYQYDTAHDRQELLKEEKLLRQQQISQNTDTDIETEQIPVESATQSTEKVSNQDIASLKTTLRKSLIDMNKPKFVNVNVDGRDIIVDTTVYPYMEESPFGFGPYPKIPAGWNGFAIWMTEKNTYDMMPDQYKKNMELMARVTIKLWNEGRRDFTSSTLDRVNGKVYLNIPNTVYIKVVEDVQTDGSVTKRITRKKGYVPQDVDLLNPPSHITVLDYDSSGIDPYKYLNINN